MDPANPTVLRIWRGWTTSENAEPYERLLWKEIFPGIAAKQIPGYLGIRLLRRSTKDGEVEFMTIMSFDSWDAVRTFGGGDTAGGDFERAYVPDAARAVLKRFDERSVHYEVRQKLSEPETP